ncbi:hypothetical protein T265_03761 [Opisthorchis viverrini]|uniref:Heparan-sulfate 6-O-sulfotransferase n=1 Tax=Opisthorchis viverrini TaxID=6198 RepID=A0A074ZV14_OPIVI|nr:hypothetical protein T265_03761 [Opisthorchis viverrini]KER29652.1 hypothetical protein T265_03761 [Opisthorchis viverrini]
MSASWWPRQFFEVLGPPFEAFFFIRDGRSRNEQKRTGKELTASLLQSFRNVYAPDAHSGSCCNALVTFLYGFFYHPATKCLGSFFGGRPTLCLYLHLLFILASVALPSVEWPSQISYHNGITNDMGLCRIGCQSSCQLRRKYYFLLGLSVFMLLFLYYALRETVVSYPISYNGIHFFLAATQKANNDTTVIVHPLHSSVQQSVLVFLHIQKTGGSLVERRLVKDGLRNRSCLCTPHFRRCECRTKLGNTWIVSRFSTGWICGLHADLTEYTECVQDKLTELDGTIVQRRFIYFTLLRNPVDRFLSEWLHVRRGATWHGANLHCGGRPPDNRAYRPCYTLPEFSGNSTQVWFRGHPTWTGVDLDTFVKCKYNLALNRQTRMLANLRSLGCYRHLLEWNMPRSPFQATVPQRALLNSAKYNLATFLRTFGLSDYLAYTQYLYQRSLHITFNRLFVANESSERLSHAYHVRRNMSDSQLQLIRDANGLDQMLYDFVTRLFTLRITWHVARDSSISMRHKRPLLTLWHARNFRGLEDILLDTNNRNYFRRQFTIQLIRLLKRQGSSSPSREKLSREQSNWDQVLLRHFGEFDSSSVSY